MVLLFDVNGTLTDTAAIGEPWHRPELGRAALAAAVQTATVDALTGHYRPFADHLRAAIEAEAQVRGLDRSLLDAATERAAALPAHDDADAALAQLASAGHRLAVLTNSGAESGRRTLEAAGLARHFEAILGVDAVGTYKPHASTYEHALASIGAAAGDVMLVAAHQWDVTGARRAGLRTGWIARDGEPLSSAAERPDVRATSLADLADQLA